MNEGRARQSVSGLPEAIYIIHAMDMTDRQKGQYRKQRGP
jgi:hypothetical protein